MITRAKVTASRQRGGRVLLDVRGLDGEQRARVELLMPTGMSALPAAGADVLLLEVGSRDHVVAIQADNPALRIPGLAAGEVGLRDANGQQVILKADGVYIQGALKVTISASGPVNVTTSGAATLDAASVVVTSSNIKLGSAGATEFVRLASGANATKVKAE